MNVAMGAEFGEWTLAHLGWMSTPDQLAVSRGAGWLLGLLYLLSGQEQILE